MAFINLPQVTAIAKSDLGSVEIQGQLVSPKYASGSFSSTGSISSMGDNQILAGVPGKKFRVISARLYAEDASVDVVFRSATTAISGTAYTVANSGYTEFCEFGLFETNAGEALNLNLSSNETCSYRITYFELDA